MTTSQRWQAVLGGLGAFLVTAWPPLLVAWSAASGALGDVPAGWVLVVGGACAVLIGAVAGVAVARGLAIAEPSRDRSVAEVWGGYVLGMGVYVVVLTAMPFVVHMLFLAEEGQPLADRFWLTAVLWVVSHLIAAAAGLLAGTALVRPRGASRGAARSGSRVAPGS